MVEITAGFSMSLDGFVPDRDDGVAEVFKWYSAGAIDAEVTTGNATFRMTAEGADYIRGGRPRRGGPGVRPTYVRYRQRVGWQAPHGGAGSATPSATSTRSSAPCCIA
jgi:hypothetical protein